MNLHDQLGALESGLDALIRAASGEDADSPSSAQKEPQPAPLPNRARAIDEEVPVHEPAPLDVSEEAAISASAPSEPEGPLRLEVSRPERDVIQMTIGGKTTLLSAEGVSELIEELANVRASMSVDQPGGIAPGWRFAATLNPVMASQKQANGDRLLILRHNGHGWVPFTFTPNQVVELYTLLTRK